MPTSKLIIYFDKAFVFQFVSQHQVQLVIFLDFKSVLMLLVKIVVYAKRAILENFAKIVTSSITIMSWEESREKFP